MKKQLFQLLKILISILLLIFCFSLVDYNSVLKIISNQSKILFILSSLLIFLTLILATFRWKIICKTLNIAIGFKELLNIALFSNFIGQVLPGGGILGEVSKIFLIKNKNITKVQIIKSVIYDKLFGLFIAFSFFVISLIYFSYFILNLFDQMTILIILSIFLILIILMYFCYLKFKKYFRVWFPIDKKYFLKSIIISILIYVIVFISFAFLSYPNINGESLFIILICFPIIHFLKSFPISISGWGIREIAAIYLFSYFEVSKEVALSISISFGAIILISSFYGLAICIPYNLKKNKVNFPS